jgi:serine/threonine protein phosphatase 1
LLFRRRRAAKDWAPATEDGERIYAVGDIHGRADLLQAMFDKLEAHNDRNPHLAGPTVILLGDMIDRGPDSARVLRLVKAIQEQTDRLVVLMGNHELLMVKALEGYPGMLSAWLKSGGDQTLRSYGVDPEELGDNPIVAASIISQAIPDETVQWLSQLPLSARSGDYMFCHAGVRPGVALAAQKADDLLWIRREFLSDERDHGAMIVHGHSIETEVQLRSNRIGIDTGAYRSGVLTALYVEGNKRELIAVRDPKAVADQKETLRQTA